MDTVAPIQVSEGPVPAEAVFSGVASPPAPPRPRWAHGPAALSAPRAVVLGWCQRGGPGAAAMAAWTRPRQLSAPGAALCQALALKGSEGPAAGLGLPQFPSFPSLTPPELLLHGHPWGPGRPLLSPCPSSLLSAMFPLTSLQPNASTALRDHPLYSRRWPPSPSLSPVTVCNVLVHDTCLSACSPPEDVSTGQAGTPSAFLTL